MTEARVRVTECLVALVASVASVDVVLQILDNIVGVGGEALAGPAHQ